MKLAFFTLGLLVAAPLAFAGAPDSSKDSGMAVSLTAEEKEDVGDIHPAKPDTILSHFRGNVQDREEYVTNAKLRGSHSSSDLLSYPSGELGFNHPLGRGFSLDVIARAESVAYASHEDQSFWGFSGNAFIDYRYQPTCPRLFIGVEPYYYGSYDNGDRLSSAMVFSTGIDHGYVFNQHRTLLTVGYKFSDHFSSPDQDDRYVHSAVIGITHQLRPALFGQLSYQYQFSDYRSEPRDDSRHIGSANVIYQFNPHLFGSLGVDYIDNDSSLSVASYENFVTHLGLTLQF